jgi:hypothetical protein
MGLAETSGQTLDLGLVKPYPESSKLLYYFSI